MNSFSPGDKVCDCSLISRCGAGAYGEVWLAEDAVGGRVAVKIVPNGGRYSERELAGLRNYRDCAHENLLKIRHIEITPEYLFYTMDAADDLHRGKGDYLPDTLANRLKMCRRLDGAEIAEMLDELLAGLAELHRHHLVHRDVKPDNILFVNARAVLADAGLITLSGAGSLVGTPGFLSPRLLSGAGRAEPSDDFYALGKVVYCALTGNPVEEYPSIPREMTLSGNADWNRLFREVCENTVASSAEFRNKMQMRPTKRQSPKTYWLYVAIPVALLLGATIWFLLRSPAEKTIARSAGTPPGTERQASVAPASVAPKKSVFEEIATTPPEIEKKWRSGDPFLTALRTAGLYDAEHLEALLSLPWFSQNAFFSRLETQTQNPRMAGFPNNAVGKKPSALEKKLSAVCRDFRELELSEMGSHQMDWRRFSGDRLFIQRKMLAEDPMMQACAFQWLIYQTIDDVLAKNAITEQESAQLAQWIDLLKKIPLKNQKP